MTIKMKYRALKAATRHGLIDGFCNPWDLGCGMTWDQPGWYYRRINNHYDRCVNYGQRAARWIYRNYSTGP